MTYAPVQYYPETASFPEVTSFSAAPADEFLAPAEVYAADLPDAAQLLTLLLVVVLAMALGFLLLPLM